jgi:alpha-D-glucose phosphate-specific phosphoglucomutase
MAHERAGQPAQPEDLIDVDQVVSAYFDIRPDPANPDQRVVFGTSGHRGSSLDGAFNEAHIAATTQAICEYRAEQGYTGPLFIGKDPHALSGPAQDTALEVLVANGVDVRVDAADAFTPTPSVSLAILTANNDGAQGTADGIVVTPSHNPPRDGGFKYNPPHGGPADTEATTAIADRANALLESGLDGVSRVPLEQAKRKVTSYDYLAAYLEELPTVLDLDAIRSAGVRIGADPLGGASVAYWGAIAERFKLDLTVINP